jgi:hypothetical protein
MPDYNEHSEIETFVAAKVRDITAEQIIAMASITGDFLDACGGDIPRDAIHPDTPLYQMQALFLLNELDGTKEVFTADDASFLKHIQVMDMSLEGLSDQELERRAQDIQEPLVGFLARCRLAKIPPYTCQEAKYDEDLLGLTESDVAKNTRGAFAKDLALRVQALKGH